MKKLTFKTTINASKEKVWETLVGSESSREWMNVSWPGAYSEGIWKEGENLRFLGPEGGGTLMNLVEYKPNEYSFGRHIAALNADGTEDRTSEVALGWIGATEAYRVTEKNGKTELEVEIQCQPSWESMFNEGWPNALEKLKEIAERK